MGIIKQDVQDIYFSQHPTYRDFLQPFLFCFNINYASEKQLANTTVHAFILEPEAFMKESFGLSKEIILIYTSFSKMEARTMQRIMFNCLV